MYEDNWSAYNPVVEDNWSALQTRPNVVMLVFYLIQSRQVTLVTLTKAKCGGVLQSQGVIHKGGIHILLTIKGVP